jgi:hypothetical protein
MISFESPKIELNLQKKFIFENPINIRDFI